MDEAAAVVERYMRERRGALVATANAEMIMAAGRDAALKAILNSAQLVVPDGSGTVWAARYLGHPMPERVAGYDLVQTLLRRGARRGLRVYFFGGAPKVAERAKEKALRRYPGLEIVGVRDGFFAEAEEAAIAADIRAARPDLLLVALGVPKQEKWLGRHLASLGVGAAIGVGGTLDVMAGVMKRAPLWMQRAKLEWLYRGMKQPRRIGRLMALPKFVFRVYSHKKH